MKPHLKSTTTHLKHVMMLPYPFLPCSPRAIVFQMTRGPSDWHNCWSANRACYELWSWWVTLSSVHQDCSVLTGSLLTVKRLGKVLSFICPPACSCATFHKYDPFAGRCRGDIPLRSWTRRTGFPGWVWLRGYGTFISPTGLPQIVACWKWSESI